MDHSIFLSELQDILQTEEPLTSETLLKDLEEWDSLAVMACMAYLDKRYAVTVKYADLLSFRFVGDILALIDGVSG